METRIVDALSASVQGALATMTMTAVERGTPSQAADSEMVGEVTGIIGLAGPNSNGTLLLSFERATIFLMLENMLGEKFSELTSEVLDAIGEITNILCGDLKRRLAQHGYDIAMATPTVVQGVPVHIAQRGRSSVCIPFTTSAGRFVIATDLSPSIQRQD